jgi:hypothetical protein
MPHGQAKRPARKRPVFRLADAVVLFQNRSAGVVFPLDESIHVRIRGALILAPRQSGRELAGFPRVFPCG